MTISSELAGVWHQSRLQISSKVQRYIFLKLATPVFALYRTQSQAGSKHASSSNFAKTHIMRLSHECHLVTILTHSLLEHSSAALSSGDVVTDTMRPDVLSNTQQTPSDAKLKNTQDSEFMTQHRQKLFHASASALQFWRCTHIHSARQKSQEHPASRLDRDSLSATCEL